jgi:hypothetical protein
MKNPVLIIACVCAIAPGCSHRQHLFTRKVYFTQHASYASPKTVPTITVWIHGARPFAENRYNLGLRTPSEFDPKNELAIVADILIKSDPVKFDPNMFYIFSWSGSLDFEKRKQASEFLYHELVRKVNLFRDDHGFAPRIRLIAHSHGGNVALDLAYISNSPIEIDELVLLAPPVQDCNKHLIQSSMFKRIFNLYSTIDIPQIIDPQGLYKNSHAKSFFSGQRFTPCHNLMQVKVKINGTACGHLQFNAKPMLVILSPVIDLLNQWMDATPTAELLCSQNRFMLSMYTNGRTPPKVKKYLHQKYGEHLVIPYHAID